MSNMEPKTFEWPDYLVFSLLLFMSACIGVYHAFAGGRQSTTREFLLADKNMNVAPVAMSMLASFMSAITLMGNPAEVYNYGTQFIIIGFSYALVIPAAAHLYIPIFYNLNLTSAYEYLELRFKSKGIRLACCCTFILQMVFYMAIVLYAPALALNQVTQLDVRISVLSVGIVCTFYTALGGMKAVMYTDLIQIFIMFGGMIAIVVKGSIDVGGFSEVWRIAGEGERLELWNFDPDPRTRHTFWTLTIGATFTWLAIYAVNQAQVQRALSTPSLRAAQTALYLNIPGLIALLIITVGCGLVIFARYNGCDPVLNNQVTATDQIVPLFVMDSLGIPGLPGLFVAAIFSGALSTLSSGFNSLSAITLQDIIRNYWKKDMTEKQATLTAKLLAVGYGVVCIALSFVAARLGGILQAALALFGIVGGPILGLFSLAIFFPWANWKGAYAALFGSLIMTLWVGLGGLFVIPPKNPKKPLSTLNCPNMTTVSNMTTMFDVTTVSNMTTVFNVTGNYSSTTMTDTTTMMDTTTLPAVADWYAVSYLYYSIIACITSMVLGITVSLLTGPQDPRELDPRLITPIISKIFCCIPKDKQKSVWCGVEHDKIVDDSIEDEDDQEMGEVKLSNSSNGFTDLSQNGTTETPAVTYSNGARFTAVSEVYVGEPETTIQRL